MYIRLVLQNYRILALEVSICAAEVSTALEVNNRYQKPFTEGMNASNDNKSDNINNAILQSSLHALFH